MGCIQRLKKTVNLAFVIETLEFISHSSEYLSAHLFFLFIIATVLCCVVYCGCNLSYACSYEHFLHCKQGTVDLGLVFTCEFFAWG